jgi:Cdc6-like AAA superfamily ATPase
LYCWSCGKEFVSPDDSYCRHCGASKSRPLLAAAVVPTTSPKPLIPEELKQTAGQISNRLKQIKVSGSTVARKLPLKERVTEKKFTQPLDSTKLAGYLEKDFQLMGFALKTTGEIDDLYVEFTKVKSSNPLTGFYDPVIVRIKQDDGTTLVTIGRAKWTDKALLRKMSSGVFLPITFSLSSGLVEDKLLGMIWRSIDSYVASLGRSIEEIVMEGHGRAIEPKLFGGRKEELTVFSSRLQSTIDGHPRNIALTGQAGIGKSSLLRKFEEIAREKKCLIIRRELDPTITSTKDLANFILEAFRAEAYSNLSKKTEAWDKTRDYFRHRSFSVTGPGVGSISVGAPTEASNYILQESFCKECMHLWTRLASREIKAIVFLLDEAAQIQNIDGGWSFIKSAFTRITESGGRFMLAVAGDLDFSREGSSSKRSEIISSSPIERFLQPISLGEMDRTEIEEVLMKTLRSREDSLSPDVLDLIYDLSGGNPYLAQNILLATISQNPDGDKISSHMVELAVKKRGNLEEIFSERLEKGNLEEKRVLLALSSFSEPVSTKQLQSKLRSSEVHSPSAVIRNLLHEGLIRNSSDDKLSIFSPLFRSYLLEIARAESPQRKREKPAKRKIKKTVTPK